MDADQNRQALVANLQRVASGDRAALKDVYDATSAKLFGVCLRILGNRSEAEDVLQEVYITVWSKADRFDAERVVRGIQHFRVRPAVGGKVTPARYEYGQQDGSGQEENRVHVRAHF